MNKIAKNISGGVGVLRRVRYLVRNHGLITLYNSLVLPYFDYCSIVEILDELGWDNLETRRTRQSDDKQSPHVTEV